MKMLRLLFALAAMLLLGSCNGMLQMIYPTQTANRADLAVTTTDSYVTPSNASTLQVFASLFFSGQSYPIATYSSGLSYDAKSGDYTAKIDFGGVRDASYYVLVWLDENGNGIWDQGEPYYLSPDFTLYGVQKRTIDATIP